MTYIMEQRILRIMKKNPRRTFSYIDFGLSKSNVNMKSATASLIEKRLIRPVELYYTLGNVTRRKIEGFRLVRKKR